jgi:hypothetical protein
MQVELDMFSGRVNPAWHLNVEEAEKFFELFRALPPAPAGSIRTGLGYRGMIVTAPDSSIAGFDCIICSAGLVVARHAHGEQKFNDRRRALERWLFGTSKGRIDEEIRTAVTRELEAE